MRALDSTILCHRVRTVGVNCRIGGGGFLATKSLLAPETANSRRGTGLWPDMPAGEGATPAHGSNFLPMGTWITQPELEQYRIALISPESSEADTGRNAYREWEAGRLLILPLTWKDLIARLRGEIADSSSLGGSNVVQFGRVRVELLSMEVRRADRPVSLTAMEFKVLRFFVSNPNRVISRDELLDEVWGYQNYPCTRTVDNHVLRLRQKLEPDPPHPVHFRTVHGIGYKFVL